MSKQIVKEKDKKSAVIQVLIRYVVTDEKGKTIYDSGQKPSKSFVIQFLEFIGAMFDALTTNATDYSNVERFIYKSDSTASAFFRADGGEGYMWKGIVVGSGSTPPTNTDISLESMLYHGTGANSISYGSTTIEAVSVVAGNVDLELSRTFTNNTGEDRVVAEVAVYVRNTYIFCIIRDVLSPSVTVSDKCSVTVYYTLRTSVEV